MAAAATCPRCRSVQQPGAKFCSECGSSMTAGCPSCGSPVNPDTKFCMECGHRLVPPDSSARPGGRSVASRRLTSVLFGDLVGFTAMTESLDPEDVRERLSRYFEECSRIVARYGGVVEKFIGDAVMAVWGLPTTHEDDAERSVRAGLDLVSGIAALGADIGLPSLSLRVGIVTGEVAVTTGAQHQGMVAGDVVNTASRVQTAAVPGQVWVDDTTRLLTSAAVSYADLGSHLLKSKAEPVRLWAARSVVATARGAQRADGLEAPLVGRDRELRIVKEAYHRAEETGRPWLLVVAGDAGTGKTRLGWEFSKYADGLSGRCRWHAGTCLSYGEGVAYHPLAEAVRSRLETGSETHPADPDVWSLIERGLPAYVEDPEDRAWLGPRLGALLGAPNGTTFQRDDLYAAWTVFFERVSEGSIPVVMVIDDAQYADDGLVSFLEHLASAATFPCFVVLLTRPELLTDHPELVTNRRCTVLHVNPLDDSQMAELLDGLVEGLPGDVRDLLVQRAEGIPTYAVETVRALIDRDLVLPYDGHYVLADPDAVDLDAVGPPATLQALISARLDRLSPTQRLVVDRASVAGGSVEPRLLTELCDDVADLETVLLQLVRAQVFTVDHDPLSSEKGRYQFVQSAVRQAAYQTLSRRDRKEIHLRVLELATRDGAPEVVAMAAQHAVAAIELAPQAPDAGELRQQAVTLLQRAAEQAHSLGAPAEAVRHLRRALELVGDDGPVRWVTQLAMARACNDAGQYDDAQLLAGEARKGFESIGDLPHEAEAAAAEAYARLLGPGEAEAALEIIEPYYERLRATTEHPEAFLHVLRGYTHVVSRLGKGSVELALEAIRAAAKVGDQPMVAGALSSLAIHLLQLRHQFLGTLLLDQARAFAHDVHNVALEAHCLATLSVTRFGDDLEQAIQDAQAAVEIAGRAGNFDTASLARVARASARWAVGAWDDLATPDLREFHPDDESQATAWAALVLTACGQSPASIVAASAQREYGPYWGLLGRALAAGHDQEPTLDLLLETVDVAFGINAVFDDFTPLYGGVLAAMPIAGLPRVLDRLAEVVDGSGEPLVPGLRAHRELVEALRLAPSDAPAGDVHQHFESAVAGYDAWGSPVYAARARAAYAGWLTRRGRVAEAEPLVQQARSSYASLGALAWLAELDQALAQRHVGR